MTSTRRRHPTLSAPLYSTIPSDLPPVSALFLIDFDVKAGYTIAWKRAEPGLDLVGLVEYKSLPSGLHTVSEDLIYFVHDAGYAGLSAFVNQPCQDEETRHARMIAVGILVPLSYGRLGRAWRHAEGLKSIARKLAKDRTDTALLEKYWESNKAQDANDGTSQDVTSGETPLANVVVTFPNLPTEEPGKKRQSKHRDTTDRATLLPAENKLSPYHPAWSLTNLLDQFGPLLFPIHRAALLRKRILISCHAPVHEICDFVYDISILSNIPLYVNDVVSAAAPALRLRPLFSIGVHDIPFLTADFEASKRRHENSAAAADEPGWGWVACTTDSILAMKDTLWDMLITMPPRHSANAHEKTWPTIECPRGRPVKATHRDLRRFNALRAGLSSIAAASEAAASGPRSSWSGTEASGVRVSTSRSGHTGEIHGDTAEKLIEPLSWTALAYNGFLWWASAGEQLRSEEQEESLRDAALLADLAPSTQAMYMPQASSRSDMLADSLSSLAARRPQEEGEARIELAIIAYFHRLTTQMLTVAADLVDSVHQEAYSDESEGDENAGSMDALRDDPRAGAEDGDGLLRDEAVDARAPCPVMVDSRSIEKMGLDVWSPSDAIFVQELVATYFGCVASVEGKGVEVCGVRVC